MNAIIEREKDKPNNLLHNDCIMLCRAMLMDELGINKPFFDDCIAEAIEMVESAKEDQRQLASALLRCRTGMQIGLPTSKCIENDRLAIKQSTDILIKLGYL